MMGVTEYDTVLRVILDRLDRIERKLDLVAEELEEYSDDELEDIRRDVRDAILAYREGRDEFVSVDEI